MSDTSPSVRLRANAIAVHAGARPICSDLSFRVHAGETVHVRGPSGRGKSTLLRAVLGLTPLQGGQLQRFAEDCTRPLPPGDGAVSAWRARCVGAVRQNGNLFADWNADDHLRFAGVDHAAASAWLYRFGLMARRGAAVGSLSGGEQRRLAVARALCRPHALLVLDEPTEGLDTDNAQRVWQAIGEAAKAGAGVLVASHDAVLPAMLPVVPLPLGPEHL